MGDTPSYYVSRVREGEEKKSLSYTLPSRYEILNNKEVVSHESIPDKPALTDPVIDNSRDSRISIFSTTIFLNMKELLSKMYVTLGVLFRSKNSSLKVYSLQESVEEN